jgi:hypothetical protein
MDGVFSMFWNVFGLTMSLFLFVAVGTLVIKHLWIFVLKSAHEAQIAWDTYYPRPEIEDKEPDAPPLLEEDNSLKEAERRLENLEIKINGL